jgi:6-phosphogluconate dehydrogenase
VLVDRVHDALLAAKVCAYSQGFDLIRAVSEENEWSVDLAELARIWKGGCIIRARILDDIRAAWLDDADLPHLLVAPSMVELLREHHGALRETLALAQGRGIPVPALGASLAYFDSWRTGDLPQNLTQAQRDAFGAHGYRRRDDPDGESIHTDWLPPSRS